MNALALKKRIRDQLRQRKFQHERLERAYRHTSGGTIIVIPSEPFQLLILLFC